MEIIEALSRRNRAYNALYALGATPETVNTLTHVEVENLIAMADETMHGIYRTEQHRKLSGISPVLLRYIATGSFS